VEESSSSGGVAAGASAAAKARRLNETAEIVLVEAGPYISFANCGLPYYVGGEIGQRDSLFVTDAASFGARFRVDVKLNCRCVAIDPDRCSVTLQRSGAAEHLEYDRLVLATGTVALEPPIEGLDAPSVFTCRTVPDVDAITACVQELLPHEAEGSQMQAVRDSGLRALVIGGGYIGLECAEQLMHRGFDVTVVELLPQLMAALDPEMAQPIHAALLRAGAEVILGDAVARIEASEGRWRAILRSEKAVCFDLALLAAGVRPNVALAREAGLKLGPSGAIAVDAFQRTSRSEIFAAGDNSESLYLPIEQPRNVPLAGPANKQGRVAGANAALDLLGAEEQDPRRLRMGGVQGTGIVRVCGTVAGGTGLTERLADQNGVKCATTYVWGPSHAGYYPGAEEMLLKVTYEPESGRLLGGQVVGGEGVDKRLDVLATAIYGKLTVEDLAQLDLAYAPPFGSAKDLTVMAGFIASNARAGVSPAISAAELLSSSQQGQPPFVVDVRSQREYDAAHIDGAVNIPLDQLRQRGDQIPRDRPVVVHCGVGYRSYLAQRVLLNLGWTDVRNLLGGYALYRQVELASKGR
jgi:NADPH-dependent 2,4-dienoyl-CoA reductase/sulfur reductase-like enzyme/rhodanese-related sulfurtransferase